jgi:alkylation response protein AidB-like acyl-CoA dehydrogenase
VDFSLTPDQELLRDTARALLREHCPSTLVRAYADDPAGADPLWERLREFTGLAAGSAVDLCLFLEEMGAALAPGPFVPTVALFAPVVATIGEGQLFARVVDGAVTGSVASDKPVAVPAPEGDRVEYVAAVEPPSVIRMLERPPTRVLEPFDLSRRLVEIEQPASGVEHPIEPDALHSALARATVAISAELIGAARWMLADTLDYVKTREQFGRPIGSFQALQHRLADLDLLFERAWSSVYWAAMAVDAGDDEQHRAVHVAKASAGEAARHIAREAMQMHGGIGFTWDHDLHLYIRRAFASEELLGDTAWHRDQLAELLLDGAAGG